MKKSYMERFKDAFSALGVIAANYLPKDFRAAMIEMAGEVDKLKTEVQLLKEKGIQNAE